MKIIDYVTFEEIQELINKGFPRYYETEHQYDRDGEVDGNLIDDPVYPMPTIYEINNWLAVQHDSYVEVTPSFSNDETFLGYRYNVYIGLHSKHYTWICGDKDVEKPEDALHAGINIILENI